MCALCYFLSRTDKYTREALFSVPILTLTLLTLTLTYPINPNPNHNHTLRTENNLEEIQQSIHRGQNKIVYSYELCRISESAGHMLYISRSCAKSHMLSASQRQPHLLHVSAVDHRQIWSMNKSSRQCVTLSGFLHSHIVRCR